MNAAEDDISGVLTEFLGKVVGDVDRLGEGTRLMTDGLLDSMATVELVAFIEDRFGVEISDEDLDPDNFETPEAMVRLVRRKLGESGR
ncbi:acyl carrier protein [Actinoplanes sp. NBRC 103695]|uniref:acyl carrier protein n=1 Tax=Actinoplanes sp. NBRC 103695 TaxID=3032202 RepID=UPI0024A28CA6|nr:acyl carrier protein [Actinoplanes sp. NBRC 103695]GLZ01159.1 hypothetical protein Acsp02_84100 [Actinoplanes sp. NBRC 103695]